VRVSAGSVVLVGLFEVLKAHTDLPAVIEAVRRCQGLMLQLMAAGEQPHEQAHAILSLTRQPAVMVVECKQGQGVDDGKAQLDALPPRPLLPLCVCWVQAPSQSAPLECSCLCVTALKCLASAWTGKPHAGCSSWQ
jgi:hypothetical protein